MTKDPAVDPPTPPAETTDTLDSTFAVRRRNSNGWLILAIVLTVAFLAPAFMLMKAAAQPSARAAHAARHGFIQLDNEEGALLYQAQLFSISKGEQVYHPLDQPPYIVGTYTPAFMAAVSLTDSFNPISFTAGRTIVWVTGLGIGMLLVVLVSTAARNAPLGVLAGFLFLATWEVHRWIGYFRVDFPAIFLSLAGLAVVVLGGRRRVALAFGALLMVAGLYTKQSVIAAPAACFLALLLQRPRVRSLEFAGWMLLWGLPPLAALHLWTNGQFLRHTFAYNINTWHDFNLQVWSRHVWNMHRWFFISGLAALPLAIFLVVMGLARNAVRNDQPVDPETASPPVLFHFWQPLAFYTVLAQWNFLGISKAGSAENYLLEPIAGWSILVCLTAGAALRLLAAANRPVWQKVISTAGAVAILALITLHAKVVTQPGAYEMRFSPMLHPSRADFEAAQMVLERMREADNPLSELAVYHLQVRQDPVIQPFIMSELSRQGKWKQEPFLTDVRAGKYDLVVALDDLTVSVPTDKYTAEMLAAFHKAYKLDVVYSTPLWNYHLLVPKTAEDAPTGAEIVALY